MVSEKPSGVIWGEWKRKVETTIIYRGYIRGCIGAIWGFLEKWKLLEYLRGYIGVIWGYMEKKMESTIVGYIGYRTWGI